MEMGGKQNKTVPQDKKKKPSRLCNLPRATTLPGAPLSHNPKNVCELIQEAQRAQKRVEEARETLACREELEEEEETMKQTGSKTGRKKTQKSQEWRFLRGFHSPSLLELPVHRYIFP